MIILFLFLSLTTQGQHISYRQSTTSKGISMSVPLKTGSLFCVISKETDRNLTYVNYVEESTIGKLSFYYGAGLHFGSRQTLNWKKDANSIFLAGATCIGGVKFTYNNLFISADLTPRVDFPFFGGCEMHRYCSEHKLGSVNFSLGLKL